MAEEIELVVRIGEDDSEVFPARTSRANVM